eukprot:CAMPEP_0171709356 /NCGR_PEP_ID=MMETSP0991-20121206/15422_1 /TAXON_ID=483369 /ORGANISM="non described non described, Strain CCMP2098" /LENGTH=329 /DNA_ID=CAMNT_0012299433 /DNA_START=83 /DNA_END=1069 /DNA_ORIENTATION=+
MASSLPPSAIPPGVFLGIGNPLLDMVATVDKDFLRKYDVTMNSASMAEERHLPLLDELLEHFDPQFNAGGCAQNSVRVTQWMVGIPGATATMGCIGLDELGTIMKQCILAAGVNSCYLEDPDAATGTSSTIISAQGERALITNFAAATKFNANHLHTSSARSLIGAAKFIYVHGFFLMDNADSLMEVARVAAQEDKTFMLNLAAPFLMHYFQERVLPAVPYCDYLFCNDAEALAFGHIKGWGEDVPKIALLMAALPKISGTRPRVVVVTQGAGETVVAAQGKITTYAVEKLANELLVDINGAGDAFVGGFVAKLLQGEKLGNCVRAGHW